MVCAAPAGRSISPDGLQARLQSENDLVIVDVRNPAEWLPGRIPGAIGWPKPELERALQESGAVMLPRDRDIVLVCQSGMRSNSVIRSLVEAGYDPVHLYNLEKGMDAWQGEVQPV